MLPRAGREGREDRGEGGELVIPVRPGRGLARAGAGPLQMWSMGERSAGVGGRLARNGRGWDSNPRHRAQCGERPIGPRLAEGRRGRRGRREGEREVRANRLLPRLLFAELPAVAMLSLI